MNVGTFGSDGSRSGNATASGLKRPALMCGMTSEGWPPPSITCPPASVVTASAPPAKGTVTMLMPAALPSAVAVMSTAPALVDTDEVTGLPSFLAQAIMSFSVLNSDLDPVQMTTEWMDSRATVPGP